MSERVDFARWAERVATSQQVTSRVNLYDDPPPTRNQIAAVMHALADFTHNQFMLSDDVRSLGSDRAEYGDRWELATGLGRYFHALGDQLEQGPRSAAETGPVSNA